MFMNRGLINDRMNETQKLLAGFGCSPGDYQMAVAAMTAMLTKPRKKQTAKITLHGFGELGGEMYPPGTW